MTAAERRERAELAAAREAILAPQRLAAAANCAMFLHSSGRPAGALHRPAGLSRRPARLHAGGSAMIARCRAWRVIIGRRYCCRLPADHRGPHRIGSGFWA